VVIEDCRGVAGTGWNTAGLRAGFGYQASGLAKLIVCSGPDSHAEEISESRHIVSEPAVWLLADRRCAGKNCRLPVLRLYIVGEHIHNGRAVREALLSFFPTDKLPASTWIGVTALASKDFLIEIEAIAVLE
jgi:hypothetical protein